MSLLDWLIVVLPTAFVLGMGWYSRRYIKGVVDFLSAGRLCGRYVLLVGDIANGISILSVISYIERTYKVGFSVSFWGACLLPLTLALGMLGYCIYRFRETRAQSLGQFLEIRYGSRRLRIFASALRTTAEMLAHSIMPAIAARFFIYFLGLPEHFTVFGVQCSTFFVIMIVCMTLAISLICMGGTLTIVLTDTLQGMFCVPLMVVIIVFIIWKFDWGTQMVPVLMDRVQGESFLNPYDVEKLRDFNLFMIFVSLVTVILHRATWYGVGAGGAARTPHEQKMAAILAGWRGYLSSILYILLAVSLLTVLNHKDFAPLAHEIRTDLSTKVAKDIVKNPGLRKTLIANLTAIPEQRHEIGKDAPLSDKKNLETIYVETARKTFLAAKLPDANGKTQEFRTLYHQTMVSVTMKHLFGAGILGLFCLLMVLAMVSTDDSFIFSSTQTLVQDVILPFFKNPPSPQLHINLLRWTAIGIGCVFIICSLLFAQIDYIELFRTIVLSMYLGGCGPMMIFGLYSRFGTLAGTWASLFSGMVLSFISLGIQRNWANIIYPFLDGNGWVDTVSNFLWNASYPLHPYVQWKMNPAKCPINSYEFFFMIEIVTLVLYVVVSYATCKEPFNLDRMLHRGIYNIHDIKKDSIHWSFHTFFRNLAGITTEHSCGDRIISWTMFTWSYVYSFFGCFILVIIWNAFSPWPISYWGNFFYITNLLVPAVGAAITSIWFSIGGLKDMYRLFHDLRTRDADPLDNGIVKGNVSAADAAKFKEIEESGKNSK